LSVYVQSHVKSDNELYAGYPDTHWGRRDEWGKGRKWMLELTLIIQREGHVGGGLDTEDNKLSKEMNIGLGRARSGIPRRG